MTAIGSSRLFVKNLPVKYTDEQVTVILYESLSKPFYVRNTKFQVKFLFGKHGEVTDCKLLKDKNGKSRRCAYVGYSKESDAAKALKKLNGTTLGISKERFSQYQSTGSPTTFSFSGLDWYVLHQRTTVYEF